MAGDGSGLGWSGGRGGRAGAFVTVLFFALVAAVLELIVLGVERYVFGAFVLSDFQIVWMTPLSYALFFLPLALVAVLGSRLAPRIVTPRLIVFVAAATAAISVLWLFYPRLHRFAILLLALGVAVQSVRWTSPRPIGFARLTRWTVASVTAAALVLGIGLNVRFGLAERRGFARLPEAPRAANVLLIVLDTVRSMSMSLYGYGRETTPVLEGMAQDAVLYRRAIATAPWTLPTHATLLTGRYPHRMSAGWLTPLDDADRTVSEVLRDRGFATAAFMANLEYTGAETGLARGFLHFEDYEVSPGEIAVSSSVGRFVLNNPRVRALVGYHDILARRTAPEIVDAFLEWLPEGGDRPFFAFLNFYDAHEPYLPPEPYASRFGNEAIRDNRMIRNVTKRMAERAGKPRMSEAEREAERGAYEGAIAHIDDELGRLFEELERRGVLETTIVIVTSDHGEMFGEHGLFTHGQSLFLPVLEVPLLVRLPNGAHGGAVVEDVVSLRDVPATILAVVAPGSESAMPGVPLPPVGAAGSAEGGWHGSIALAAVEPAPNQREGYPSSRGPMQSIVAGRWHYIRNAAGEEQLFDLAEDPDQLTDRAGDSSVAEVLVRSRSVLDSLLSRE